jgi:hypothetical protein
MVVLISWASKEMSQLLGTIEGTDINALVPPVPAVEEEAALG